MNFILKHKLTKLAQKADPNRDFVSALEKHLKSEVDHPLRWVQPWKWMVGGMMALSLVGSATGVYAYTSDDVLPDHPLYGLRQTIEHVEETVAVTPQLKQSVQQKHLERRKKEQKIVNAKKRTALKTELKKVKQDLDLDDATGTHILPETTKQELKEKAQALKKQIEEIPKNE